MMSNTEYELPNISVDVVPVTVNLETNQLEVLVGRRIFEPYLGEYALPGVLLTPHERLVEAATRALETKTLVNASDIVAVYDLGTFDNPDRDPRGATVSIAKIAIIAPHVIADEDKVKRIAIDAVANGDEQLPFDHNTIVQAAATLFGEKFLSSKTFTKSILGEQFSTKIVRGLLTQMGRIASDSDHTYDASNLTRQLKSTGWVDVVDEVEGYATTSSVAYATSTDAFDIASQMSTALTTSTSTGRGRPSRTWTWK
jgi:8-oxo-dGTP diphosphatase